MPVWPKVTVQNPAIDGYAFPCSTGRGSKAEVLGEKLLQLAVDGSDNLPAVRLALRADLSVWGQSNLLASVPAGRVPFADGTGAVTSNAGLAFNSGTGTLTAGNLTLGNGAENSPSLNLGDPTTGFWRASAQSIGVTHQGIASNVFFGDQQRLRSTNRFGWASGSAVLTTIDAELTRISPGFVGLGSPTNKVSVGHNGTSGTINTATGNLVLSAASGPSLTVRTDNTFDIGANGTHTAGQRMALGSGGLNLVSGSSLTFASSSTQYFTGVDLRIRRSSANTLDLDTGTDGAFADLRLRNLTASGEINTGGNYYSIRTLRFGAPNDAHPCMYVRSATASGAGYFANGTVACLTLRSNSQCATTPSNADIQLGNANDIAGGPPRLVLNQNKIADYTAVLNANTTVEGGLTVQQPNGTAGTDEVRISHDGTRSIVTSMDGVIELRTPAHISGRHVRITDRAGGVPAIDATGPSRLILDAVLAAVNSGAGWQVDAVGNLRADGTTFQLGWSDASFARNASGVIEVNSGTAGTLRDLTLNTLNASGNLRLTAWGGYVGIATGERFEFPTGGIIAHGRGTANPVLRVRGVASQTGDLFRLENDSGAILLSFNANGGITTGRTLTDNPLNTFWGNHGNNPAIFVRATGGNGSNVGYGWMNSSGTQIATLMTDPLGNNLTNLRLSLLAGSSFDMFVAGSQVASISAAGVGTFGGLSADTYLEARGANNYRWELNGTGFRLRNTSSGSTVMGTDALGIMSVNSRLAVGTTSTTVNGTSPVLIVVPNADGGIYVGDNLNDSGGGGAGVRSMYANTGRRPFFGQLLGPTGGFAHDGNGYTYTAQFRPSSGGRTGGYVAYALLNGSQTTLETYGFTSNLYLQSGSTATNHTGFFSTGQFVTGANNTATNLYDFRTSDASSGSSAGQVVTNRFGVYLGHTKSGGNSTNSWGVYQEAADVQNFFCGGVRVGVNVANSVNLTGVGGGNLQVSGATFSTFGVWVRSSSGVSNSGMDHATYRGGSLPHLFSDGIPVAAFTPRGCEINPIGNFYNNAGYDAIFAINRQAALTEPVSLAFYGESSTTARRSVGAVNSVWADSTDATRAGRLTLGSYGMPGGVQTLQEGIRIDANSGGVRLGFYGATAVGRQTVSAAATDPATTMALVNELRADLIALGLIQ